MGGSSGGGTYVNIARYAPYIESQHGSFLNTLVSHRNNVIDDSPYADYSPIDASEAYFGLGYLISNFPSLYDMFGKHMAGLDIGGIWKTVFEKVYGEPSINAKLSEEVKLVDDDLVKEVLSDLQVNMRNINAVVSSSFVIGKAVTEDKRVKAFAKMSLDVKVELLDTVGREYATRLNWERLLVIDYAKIMKDYFISADRANYDNYGMASLNALWPFTVLAFEGRALGVLQSVNYYRSMRARERSALSKILLVASYAVTGAVIGAEVGGPWGAVIGAVVGIIVGIAMLFLE